MTAEEQKRMDALEAENAKLRGENSELQDKLLAAQKTLAKYAQMLFGQRSTSAPNWSTRTTILRWNLK